MPRPYYSLAKRKRPRLGGTGIHIGNTPFEGLAAADYVIQRNLIQNCGLLPPRRPPPTLPVSFLRADGATPLHRNLLIADNVLRENPERPIEIHDNIASDARLSGLPLLIAAPDCTEVRTVP